jgi:hypothetical protein
MHPLDKLANSLTKKEEQFFDGQSNSSSLFEMKVIGNPKTGDQIEEWESPGTKRIGELFKNWDGESPLNIETEEGGEIKRFDDILYKNEIPEILPDIGQMVLYKSSKVTDFISGSFLEHYGLIVSAKAKKLLEEIEMGDFGFFPLEIKHKKKIYKDYYFFKCKFSAKEFIDFTKSSFYTQEGIIGIGTKKKIELNSKDEVDELYKSLPENTYLFVSEIFLKDTFPKVDLFRFCQFGINKIIVSKALAEQLVNLSGVEIVPVNRIKKNKEQD